MADRESNAGLTEVDPSPVDETPADFKSDYFPDASSSRSNGTSFLGLGQHSHHSAIYYLSRVQKYSSYVFTAFAAAHVHITASRHINAAN